MCVFVLVVKMSLALSISIEHCTVDWLGGGGGAPKRGHSSNTHPPLNEQMVPRVARLEEVHCTFSQNIKPHTKRSDNFFTFVLHTQGSCNIMHHTCVVL